MADDGVIYINCESQGQGTSRQQREGKRQEATSRKTHREDDGGYMNATEFHSGERQKNAQISAKSLKMLQVTLTILVALCLIMSIFCAVTTIQLKQQQGLSKATVEKLEKMQRDFTDAIAKLNDTHRKPSAGDAREQILQLLQGNYSKSETEQYIIEAFASVGSRHFWRRRRINPRFTGHLFEVLMWKKSKHHWYKYFTNEVRNHDQANANCSSYGVFGNVASTILRDKDAVRDIISSGLNGNHCKVGFWIGGSRRNDTANRWIHSYTGSENEHAIKWVREAANTTYYSGCGSIVGYDNGTLLIDALPCESRMHYICEFEFPYY